MKFRTAARTFFRSLGLEVTRYTRFAMACDLLARTSERPTFLQIGANNGTDFDDTYAIVTRNDLPGVVVEPIPRYFDALVQAYARFPDVKPVRTAIHPTAKSMPMFAIKPDRATVFWQHGLASFSRDHLLGHYGVTEDMVEEQTVPCMTLPALIDQHLKNAPLDILAVDTEGFDAEILGMMDWQAHRPKVVRFEKKHLEPRSFEALRDQFQGMGYRTSETFDDCTAVSPELSGRAAYLSKML